VNTLALKCRARTLDNAFLDRRQASFVEERFVLHTTSSPSCSDEDTIATLPGAANFKRPCRKRSNRRSCSADWDTPLAKIPEAKTKVLKPLLSDITLPRNYVPPFRLKEEDQPNKPFAVVEPGNGDGLTKHLRRRVSRMSQFSQNTTESGKEEKTRWGEV
jgi:hypothetical protein